MRPTNIVLVGPMGSGKTSIGRKLATVLKCDFFDSDFEIIKRTGVSIEHIFDVEGEGGFRQRESKILADLCIKPNIILATGGGIVMRVENRNLLKQSFVVYLSATIEQLVKNTQNSKDRPLLQQSTDREKTLRDLLKDRLPLYRQVADIVIDTVDKKPYMVINEIKKIVQQKKILNQ